MSMATNEMELEDNMHTYRNMQLGSHDFGGSEGMSELIGNAQNRAGVQTLQQKYDVATSHASQVEPAFQQSTARKQSLQQQH